MPKLEAANRGRGRIPVYRDIPDEWRNLIEPIVEDHGCELVDVDVVRGAGASLVRITVDSPTGDGQVPVERCAEISRETETHLDAADWITASYRLEVTSPGLNRVLAREKDFSAACGSEVNVKTRRALNGRRKFRGVLVEFIDGVAKVTVDGHREDIPFEDIEKANTVYSFSRDDFQGGSAK